MINAIEHSDMQVKLKMTDTIFLDPIAKAKKQDSLHRIKQHI